MNHILQPLPYESSALAPYISKETVEYHYGKHHQAYVDTLNKLVRDTPLQNARLEDIVKKSSGEIFNNAAQVWNHTFYWNGLIPGGSQKMSQGLADEIDNKWGSFDEFKSLFSQSCIGNFGSGWTWLVKKPDGMLAICNTSNAATPITGDDIPLLVCDVWEHAYYIDFRNVRADYVASFFNLVNWQFVSENFLMKGR